MYRELPFWDKLTETEKEKIESNIIIKQYEKGYQMIHCESGCDGVMLIRKGIMRVYITSEEGREVTLYRLFEGDSCVLSAAGLLDAITFDVMIEAVEDSEVIMIPTPILKANFYRHPEIEAYIYRTAAERF